MLKNIKDLKAVLNSQGFYDIMVNGVVVGEMLGKGEIAEYIEWVLNDPDGMIADMLDEEGA